MSIDLAPPEARQRSGRAAPVVLVAVLVLAAVAVGLSAYRWTHPRLFQDYAGDISVEPRAVSRAAESFSVVFPAEKGGAETVVLNTVRARWSTNTARATATFWICHRRAGENPIGSSHAPSQDCGDMVPVTPGGTLRYSPWPGSDYLFVTVTPTVPGVARLTGVDVGYRRSGGHFFQHGTQTIGTDFTITAT